MRLSTDTSDLFQSFSWSQYSWYLWNDSLLMHLYLQIDKVSFPSITNNNFLGKKSTFLQHVHICIFLCECAHWWTPCSLWWTHAPLIMKTISMYFLACTQPCSHVVYMYAFACLNESLSGCIRFMLHVFPATHVPAHVSECFSHMCFEADKLHRWPPCWRQRKRSVQERERVGASYKGTNEEGGGVEGVVCRSTGTRSLETKRC